LNGGPFGSWRAARCSPLRQPCPSSASIPPQAVQGSLDNDRLARAVSADLATCLAVRVHLSATTIRCKVAMRAASALCARRTSHRSTPAARTPAARGAAGARAVPQRAHLLLVAGAAGGAGGHPLVPAARRRAAEPEGGARRGAARAPAPGPAASRAPCVRAWRRLLQRRAVAAEARRHSLPCAASPSFAREDDWRCPQAPQTGAGESSRAAAAAGEPRVRGGGRAHVPDERAAVAAGAPRLR